MEKFSHYMPKLNQIKDYFSAYQNFYKILSIKQINFIIITRNENLILIFTKKKPLFLISILHKRNILK